MAKVVYSKSLGTVRIIGGKWRSRNLHFKAVNGLRPTGSRIRETLFNWLSPSIEGANCLDLFAGSGALCFEALSRGASAAVAVEINDEAVLQLRKNQAQLGAESLSVIANDCLRFLAQGNRDKPYDIIFMDPPFERQLHSQVCELLVTGNWLAGNAQIYCELPAAESQNIPASWRPTKNKVAGKVRYCIFEFVEQNH